MCNSSYNCTYNWFISCKDWKCLRVHYNQYLPQAPRELRAMVSKGSSIILRWSPPIDHSNLEIIEYRIYRGLVGGGESLLATVPGSATSYLDTNVTRGQTYYYMVSAVNSVGEGPLSSEVNVTLTIGAEEKQPKTKTISDYWWVFLLLAIVLIVIVLLSRKRPRSPTTKPSSQTTYQNLQQNASSTGTRGENAAHTT